MNEEIDRLVDAGVAAHCAGDSLAAALFYARVLLRSPTHTAANLLSMCLAKDAGDWAAARDFEGRAGARPGAPSPYWPPEDLLHFARVLLAQGRPDLAMGLVINVALHPKAPDVAQFRAEIEAAQDKLVGAAPADDAFTRDLLIICPTYLGSPRELELLNFWRAAVARFNPGIDWLMIDDGSPKDMMTAGNFGAEVARFEMPGEDAEPVPLGAKHTIASFRTNAGHLRNSRGQDGWSRSIATGVKTAIANGYRHLVVLEMDMYTRLSLRKIVEGMRVSGAKAVTARVKPWHFIETAFMALDVAHVARIRFTDRYDWKKPFLTPKPEWVYEAILRDVTIMPWTGGRNDFGKFDPAAIAELDILTHCKDVNLYRRYIEGAVPEAQQGAAALRERAKSLAADKRLDEALACYDDALRIDRDDVAALNGRGLVLEQLNRFDEALTCYDRVLEIDSGIAGAHCNRGNVLGRLQRFEEALASYDKALAIKPDHPAALNNRSWALQEAFSLASFKKTKKEKTAGRAQSPAG
jgi:tetratricopeptide (TPR) repeat protein